MKKDTKQLTPKSQFLLFLLDMHSFVSSVQSRTSLYAALYPELREYRAQRNFNQLLYRFKQSGLISYEYKEAKRIIKLTSKGELEALLKVSQIQTKQVSWDGRWTIICFDIPEAARNIRAELRSLLKQYGCKPLQGSVYIHPSPLSEQALGYLKKTGLIDYIRIFRADETAGTSDLHKLFKNLTTSHT